MPDWVWLWIYLIGWALTVVPVSIASIKEIGETPPSGFDYIMGCILGFLVCSFWPLFIPIYLIYIQVRKAFPSNSSKEKGIK